MGREAELLLAFIAEKFRGKVLGLLSADLLKNPTLKSKFITLFSACGQLDEARRAFRHGIEEAGEVLESVYAAMAIGFSRNGRFREALVVYNEMLLRGVEPGNFSFSVALKASSCALDFRIGKCVHAQIVKAGEEPDQVVYNALLKFYTECGSFEEVLNVFNNMPDRNVSTWNALVAGFVKKDQRYTGHGQIVKSVASPDVLVLNSLLDMYAKCGVMEYCKKVFDGMISKDLTSWNTLINGYAINGLMAEAVSTFEQMVEDGIKPDGVTFISLLSGCSHVRMVNEGKIFFNRMRSDFGLNPTLEHYACLVDMFGRAGRIEEALEIVKKMPLKPSGSVRGSLLNSSMWDKVNLVREEMEKRGLKKEAGCSWVQIKDRVQSFVAGGGFEFHNSNEFKRTWDELMGKMEESGYRADTGVVLHDIDEEMKVEWVCGHSERLATVFALVHTGSGLPIRVTKNLRVCADCHSWMKYVSEVSRRKIILRDTNRFHHFDQGKCSCNDYW
ncbi:hypothetical protein BUALT_Bualt18G0088100 [Buddleja alternifolia]|uniref:DYW domain-containing protein n=1 Tax=Buddleja alternifolia TaxID=168488 RepID=A0AAV6WE24_9LAMI|nr:hypothetical protein BUALT_Bualt18G0088100 [Buddleja alternifolia]